MDELQKLLFSRANVRGEAVALRGELAQALEHQHLPVAAKRLAGEAASAGLLAAAALQFDGTVLLQIEGDGPVRLVVAEVRPDFSFRVMAKLRDDADPASIDPNAKLQDLVNVHGRGRCALILDMTGRTRDQQPYQGVVPLEGDTLAEALEAYFAQSEQVETVIRLASDESAAGGVMLQKMPATGGKLPQDFDPEGWQRLKMFAQTVKSAELLTLRPTEVNRRLFWEESPLVTLEAEPKFRCSCSPERFEGIVRSMGREEAEKLLAEEGGRIKITCSFCGRSHEFDSLDVKAIFENASCRASGSSRGTAPSA